LELPPFEFIYLKDAVDFSASESQRSGIRDQGSEIRGHKFYFSNLVIKELSIFPTS
jgi:hypothetical protein